MTFAAALIRGLTGFGLALILVPLLGIIMRPDEAVIVAILLQALIGPVGLGRILADCHRPSVQAIAIAAVMTTPIGVWVLALTPPDIARIAIAAIALGAFALTIVQRKAADPPGYPAALATGSLAGFLTGFAAMPGPPVVPFYLRDAFTPPVARASMMAVFLATAMAGTVAAWLLGMLTLRLVSISLVLFVPLVIGNAIGGRAFGMVSPLVWRSVAGLLLGAAAASAVWRAV